MKKIKFKKISLRYFCGILIKEIELGDNLTIISGRNGIGKSSIAKAISYALFGTDDNGNALDIKTFDKSHNIIQEIPHEVELILSVDGDEIVLKRVLTDKWVGDKCTNTFKYYIDNEVATAGDFKKVVNDILFDKAFSWLVNPSQFLTETWQTQRAFLQQIAPEITIEAITGGDEKYDFVIQALKKQDIEKLTHHIRYTRGEVQKQLDEIKPRLEELDKALPKKEDYGALKVTLDEKETELTDINSKITTIKTGGVAQVRSEGIRKQLEFQRKRIDEMEKGARKLASDEATKHQSDMITASTAKSKANAVVEELKAKMKGFTDTEIHIKDQLEELDEKNKKGAKQYEETSAEKWQWNDEDSFCPHCGQPLPLDKLAQIKRESEEHFNDRKARRLKELVAWAGDIKKEKEQCQKLLEQLYKDRTDTMNQLTEAHKALKEAEAHYTEVDKEIPRSYTEILNKNENYMQADNEVCRLEDELNKPVEGDGENQIALAKLEELIQPLKEEINSLRSRLATKESFDHINTLIEECKKNKETYQNQLDELDEKLAIANEYNQRSCALLEAEVNKHFKFVQWSLFKTNLEGDKKPYCECYHDGVPYSRLNGAAKVNAAIDIAYTIANFYDVSVPMVLDECESNLHPIYRGGQQVRLAVSPDEELQIKYSDGNQD